MAETKLVEYHKGIDIFYSDASEKPIEGSKCLACGAFLAVERRETFRSMAEAMSGSKADSYVYYCLYSPKKGHEQLVLLYKEWEGLVSKGLKSIVMRDLIELREEFKRIL